MKSKDSSSTKCSNSAPSTETRLRNYREFFFEVKQLYEVNKEIFKINLSSCPESDSQRAISGLLAENKLLYDLLMKHFLRGEIVGSGERPGITIVKSEVSGEAQWKELSSKLLKKIERLERDLKSGKRSNKENDDLLPAQQLSTSLVQGLNNLKEKKGLEARVLQLEAKLRRMTGMKNELLRQNFVS